MVLQNRHKVGHWLRCARADTDTVKAAVKGNHAAHHFFILVHLRLRQCRGELTCFVQRDFLALAHKELNAQILL